ncbi:hypothetical protein JCM17092_25700 [Haloplanus litoreus]
MCGVPVDDTSPETPPRPIPGVVSVKSNPFGGDVSLLQLGPVESEHHRGIGDVLAWKCVCDVEVSERRWSGKSVDSGAHISHRPYRELVVPTSIGGYRHLVHTDSRIERSRTVLEADVNLLVCADVLDVN